MPPRKKSKKESESEDEPDFVPSDDASDSSDGGGGDDASGDSDFGGSQAKKTPPKRKAPAAKGGKKKISALAPPKRKSGVADAPAAAADVEGGSQEEADEKPKKKRAPAKKKEFVPAEDDPWSYVTEGGTLIWRDFGTEPNEKIAAFDLDGTLVNTKSGGRFASSSSDWRFYNKKVPKVVKDFADEGYKIVIFTNQGGIKGALGGKAAENVKKRVEQVVEALGVPAQVFMAPQNDKFRKPEAGMWAYLTEHCNGGVKPSLRDSFFVGDAAGRAANAELGHPEDFSDSDKLFAKAAGIGFKVPDEVFGEMEGKRAIDGAAQQKGREALAAGEGPNAALLRALQEYADLCFDEAKNTGDDKFRFKGGAMKKAVASLATFSAAITHDQLKAVLKLPGVGKGTVERIKEYLDTGKLEPPGGSNPEAAAKREAVAKDGNKRQEAAMAFL